MSFAIGTPHTRNAGYFVNDIALKTRQEADIQTCTHCQAIIKMQAWRLDGAWCSKCSAPICSHCGKRALTFGCEPFVKQLEAQFKQIGKFNHFIREAGQDQPVAPRPLLVSGS